MNFVQARLRLVQSGAVLAAVALVAGCGNNYRPVITPANPSGPPAQPEAFAVVISAPSSTTPGIATVIDYAGDTVMAEAPIGTGPTAFTLDALGAGAFTLNSDGTMTSFPVSVGLQEKEVVHNTLPSTAQPVNLLSTSSSGIWATDLCVSDPTVSPCQWNNVFSGVDVFAGNPQTFLRSIPLAPTPVAIVSSAGFSQRAFAISQGNSQGGNVSSGVACNISPSTVGVNGEADGIEISSYTISSQIPLGQCPVYAVQSADAKRLFVLNRGSDTVTVINTQNNALDTCSGLVNQLGQPVTCHPTLPLSTTAISATGITPPNCNLAADPTCGGMTATAGPVYAEYNAATSQLVVANYDGGTVSVIDGSLDQYGNDSPTFGATFTISVGKNPASVTVLFDGSRAYTANQTDGTVSIVNLSSHSLEKSALPVVGHPRTVVSTQNSSYGKVYVASPDSPYLTIVRTDQDIVDTTVLVEGNIVDVRGTSQNGLTGNGNTVSRSPGFGEPCNLPLSEYNPASSSTAAVALSDCRVQDETLLQ